MLEKALPVKLLAMDVDGVLTTGEIIYSDNGVETKAFNILDGLGLAVARKAGLITAIVTGRKSESVSRRARELGITELCQGVRYKANAIRWLMQKYDLRCEEIAYVGDDINDIPAFRESGLCIAVRNACNDLKPLADYITEQQGGRGAIREVVEMILRSQDRWDSAVQLFIEDLEQSDVSVDGFAHQ